MNSALALITLTVFAALGAVLLAAGIVRIRRARPHRDVVALSLVRVSLGVAVSTLILIILTV
jgi:hypothetical protein